MNVKVLMKVLSLFDGMSCGQIALDRAGIEAEYHASEIDPHCIKVCRSNYHKTKQLGDIKSLKNLSYYDLILAGSPCQGFSFAGGGLDFDDPRSSLFFDFYNILIRVKPKWFLLENVVMLQKHQDVISNMLETEPVMINSSMFSAQNRERLYWTNIKIPMLPERSAPILRDILVDEYHPKFLHSERAIEYMDRKVKGGRTHWDFGQHSDVRNRKSSCVVANFYKGVPYNVLVDGKVIRRFTPREVERLQTVPDNYTMRASELQRYKMLGNGWTIDVISHILKGMNESP